MDSLRHTFLPAMLALALAAFALPQNAQAQSRNKKARNVGDIAWQEAAEPDAPTYKGYGDTPIPSQQIVSLEDVRNGGGYRNSGRGNINNRYTEGIDISHYQGSVNWDLVAQEPISYVYIKATEGANYVDQYYNYNMNEAHRIGLSVGSYHFYRPNISPEEQFANITRTVKPGDQDLAPMIDIEARGKVSHGKFISDLRRFVELVTEHYGRKPLLYTYHNFYNSYLQGQFSDYHFMIARYAPDEPWLNDGKNFFMWQYSQSGRVSGIKGNVDRSRIMSSYSLGEIGM